MALHRDPTTEAYEAEAQAAAFDAWLDRRMAVYARRARRHQLLRWWVPLPLASVVHRGR